MAGSHATPRDGLPDADPGIVVRKTGSVARPMFPPRGKNRRPDPEAAQRDRKGAWRASPGKPPAAPQASAGPKSPAAAQAVPGHDAQPECDEHADGGLGHRGGANGVSHLILISPPSSTRPWAGPIFGTLNRDIGVLCADNTGSRISVTFKQPYLICLLHSRSPGICVKNNIPAGACSASTCCSV